MIEVVEIKSRINQMSDEFSEVKGYAAVMFCSAMAAFCSITDGIAPFGVAAVAASKGRYTLCSAVGAGIGYLLSPKGNFNVQYLAAILLVICLRWAVTAADYKQYNWLDPLIGGFAVMSTTAIVAINLGLNLSSLVLIIAEGIMSTTAGYIFIVTYRHSAKNCGKVGEMATATTAVIVATGLCSLSLGQLSLGRVAIIAVACGAAISSSTSVSSIVSGAAMIPLLVTGNAYVGVSVVVAAVVSSAFKGVGRIVSALAFMLCGIGTAYLVAGRLSLTPSMIEFSIASTIAICLPRAIFNAADKNSRSNPNMLSLATTRLIETATALKEVAELTSEINSYIDKSNADESELIYSKSADEVCKRCKNSAVCWQSHFNDTMGMIGRMISDVKLCGHVRIDELPVEHIERCGQLDRMATVVTGRTLSYIKNHSEKRQVSKMRTVVSGQFDGVASILERTAEEIDEIRELDRENSQKVTEMLSKYNLDAVASCYEDKSGLKTIMLRLPSIKVNKALESNLEQVMGAIVGEKLNKGRESLYEGTATILYTPKPAFKAEIASSTKSATGERWCGDSFSVVDNDTSLMIALSDGMGTGGKAAVDSIMTTTLLTKLYKAGVDPNSSLKLINAALLAKSTEERLATVDCCVVDLYNGEAEFFKAGAVASYIIRKDRVYLVESEALPAGILGDVSFDARSSKIYEDDIVVIVSDGVSENDETWILSELRMIRKKTLQEIVDHLVSSASYRKSGYHNDDMTAIAFTLKSVDNYSLV